jgi:hypothetical protein
MDPKIQVILQEAAQIDCNNKQKRFYCYKQTAQFLGFKNQRQKLPLDIEQAIKERFPDEEQVYTGFIKK